MARMAIRPVQQGKPVLIACFLAVAFVALYWATASRTIIFDARDAAEFQTVGVVGGILHQPYPLWCIIAKSVSLIPVAEPAFRVTFVSILFASLTVGLLFAALVRLTGDRAASVCGSIAFGLSYTFWQNAVEAEVYALNAFLVVAWLYSIDRLPDRRPAHHSLLIGLILGYLLSLHATNVALLPLVAVLLWKGRREQGSGAQVGIAHVLALLFPVTLFGYTYLVDRTHLPLNWLDNLGQYYAQQHGITAEQFRPFLTRIGFQMWPGSYTSDMSSIGDVAGNTRAWIKQLVDAEFPLGGALLVVAGFVTLWRRDLRRSTFLALLAGSYLAMVISGFGGELYAHSIPLYMVCSIYIAVALASLRRWTLRGWGIGRPLFMIAAVVVVAAPFLRHLKASPLSTFLRSPEHVESAQSAPGPFVHLRSSNDSGKIYGERVDEIVPPNSLILAGWTEANVLFYHQLVLGSLRDVDVHYVLWTTEQTLSVIRQKHPAHVYFTTPPDARGVEGFPVREVVNVIPERKGYPARNLYEVDFAGR